MKNLLNYLLLAYRLKNDMNHELFSYSVLYRKSSNDLFFLLPPNSSEEYIDRFFSAIHARLGKAAIYCFLYYHFNRTSDKKAFLSLLYTQCKSRLEVIADRKARGLYITKLDFSPRLHICLEWINEVQNSYSFSNDQLQILEQNDIEKTNGIPETFTGTKSYTINFTPTSPIKVEVEKITNPYSSTYNKIVKSNYYTSISVKEAILNDIEQNLNAIIFANQKEKNKLSSLKLITTNNKKVTKYHILYFVYSFLYAENEGERIFKATQLHVAQILKMFGLYEGILIENIVKDYAGLPGSKSIDRQQRHCIKLALLQKDYKNYTNFISNFLTDENLFERQTSRKN